MKSSVDLDNDDFNHACYRACAEHLIGREIAFGGKNLSGGERQRAAIAGTLAKKPLIKLVDDALSALDAQTAGTVQHRMLSEDKGGEGPSTVIIVSHRVSTLIGCDRIYIMENGRITDTGTHDELIKKPGLYAKIYNLQSELEG